MNLVAVIPARGGSKSIPKKNIRLLGGRPLLAWSVDYARRCPRVARTVVSTDSEEIAEAARRAGAEVPFLRPPEHSGDLVQDYPVMRHALESCEAIYRETVDAVAWLRPTSPLRPPGLIERALSLVERHAAWSSVRAVARSGEHPFRQWVLRGDFIEGFVKDAREPYNLPRQLLPPVFFQTGDLEVIRRGTLLAGSASGPNVLPLEIRPEDMVDIDYESDWKAAEEWLKTRGNPGGPIPSA